MSLWLEQQLPHPDVLFFHHHPFKTGCLEGQTSASRSHFRRCGGISMEAKGQAKGESRRGRRRVESGKWDLGFAIWASGLEPGDF